MTPRSSFQSIEAPMAIPVIEKHYFDYSLASLFGAIATTIGCVLGIIDKKYVEGNVCGIIVALFAITSIAYAQLGHRIFNKRCVPLYSADTLSNPAMCSNILSGFKHIPKVGLRLKRNFQHPSLTPDLIEVLNKILMAFYDICGRVFTKLEHIEDKLSVIDSNTKRNAANSEKNHVELNQQFHKLDERVGRLEEKVDKLDERVGRLEEKVDKLDERVGRLEEKVDKLDEKMDRVLDALASIEAKLSSFAFVV